MAFQSKIILLICFCFLFFEKRRYFFIPKTIPRVRHCLRQRISALMEILSSVRTQYSKIQPSHNPRFIVNWNTKSLAFSGEVNSISWNSSNLLHPTKGRKLVSSSSYDEGGPIAQQGLDNSPISMELVPISSESQFDRVVAEAQQLEESIVILWFGFSFYFFFFF